MDFDTYTTTARQWAAQAIKLNPLDPVRMLYTTVNDTRFSLADRKQIRWCAEAMIRIYRQERYGPRRSSS